MRHVAAVLLPFIAGVVSAQSSQPEQYVSDSRFKMVIGTQSIGYVESWEGGDMRAPVVEQGSKRSVGSPYIAEVTFSLRGGLHPAYVEWIRGTLDGQRPARDIHLLGMGDAGSVRKTWSWPGSKVSMIRFSALSNWPLGSGKFHSITVTFAPASVSEPAQAPAITEFAGASPPVGVFRLSIDGLPTDDVREVSEITAKADANGVVRISNIVLAMVEKPTAMASWKAWLNSYVVQGHNADTDEKSGTLKLMNATGNVYLAVQLKGLGISRISHRAASGPVIQSGPAVHGTGTSSLAVHEVELSCEGLAILQDELSLAPVPLSPEPVTPVPPPAKADEDQGARDPADVPRFPECVRSAFTGSRGKTRNEESAAYVTRESIEKVEAFFTEKMKDLKWKDASRSEAGRLADLSYKLDVRWERDKQTAALTLRKRKDGATTIEWLVTTTLE